MSDNGLLAGVELSRNNISHGFVLKLPRRYLSFDDPDSEFGPNVTGINNSGLISGYYFSESDLDIHSFIGQLVP